MFFTHVHETPYFSFSEDQAVNTKNTRNSLSKEKLLSLGGQLPNNLQSLLIKYKRDILCTTSI